MKVGTYAGPDAREVLVSSHAVDRCSTRCLAQWLGNRTGPGEGLHTFLVRACREALASGAPADMRRYRHLGMVLTIRPTGPHHTLVTVWADDEHDRVPLLEHLLTGGVRVDNDEGGTR